MEGLGFKLRAEAVLQTLTEDVLKSSEIEGERLDRNQVRSSLAKRLDMDVGALTRTELSKSPAERIHGGRARVAIVFRELIPGPKGI